MPKKIVIIIIIQLLICISTFHLFKQIINPQQNIQPADQLKIKYLLAIHIFVFVSMIYLLYLEDFYFQIIWAFANFAIIAAVLVLGQKYSEKLQQPQDDADLFELDIPKISPIINNYLNSYNLVEVYSIMGAFLMGLFLLITEGVMCWYHHIADKILSVAILRVTYADTVKQQECSICLIAFENTAQQYFQVKKCKHIFHEKCLMEWIRYNTSCPLCRRNIFEYERGEELGHDHIRPYQQLA